MFVDASALVAMMTNESDARELAERLERTSTRITSPAAVWETAINLSRILGLSISECSAALNAFLDALAIIIMPIPVEAAALAINAFDRFGKGRHPASLNFGDCMAYACARHYRLPLLYKGDDFTQTDIDPA